MNEMMGQGMAGTRNCPMGSAMCGAMMVLAVLVMALVVGAVAYIGARFGIRKGMGRGPATAGPGPRARPVHQ